MFESSRILDLDFLKNTWDLRLEISNGRSVRYATLNHCWGTVQPLKLMLSSCAQVQQMIAFNDLPKIFRGL